MTLCKTLIEAEARANIDRLDQEIVMQSAEREAFVVKVACFKKMEAAMRAPSR